MKRFFCTFFVLVSCALLSGISPFGGAMNAQTFTGVSVSVKDAEITGTNSSWEFAITSPDGTGGTWATCGDPTPFTYPDTGNFHVVLREIALPTNDSIILKVAPQRIAPGYTINYDTEDAGVLAISDEYSWNADMSSATQGDGSLKITLNVDGALDTVYIRTLATDSTVISKIQKLYIPDRPETPNFSINYPAETTVDIIETTTRWSEYSDLSVSAGGGDVVLDISSFVSDVQDTLFFEHEAIENTRFKSDIGQLIIKPRQAVPSITVDFENEQTSQNITTLMEWSESESMTVAFEGTGVKKDIESYIGSVQDTLFFRNKASESAFVSLVSEMVIPIRPPAPVFTVDYGNEQTAEFVSVNQEHSVNADMSGAVNGGGTVVGLTPGEDKYFRSKAIESTSFKSGVYHLTVKSRPSAPTAEQDFLNETLISLPSDPEWNTGSGYADVSEGVDISSLIPASGAGSDKDIYVRQKSVGSEFRSDAQTISLEPRKAAPSIGSHNDDTNIINWSGIAGFSNASDYEYSASDGSSWTTCSDFSIDVDNIAIPSGDFLIRLKASNVDGSKRFAGDAAASDFEMTSVGETNLAVVGLSVVDERLSGTSTDMQYSIKKASDTDSSWVDCTNTYTTILIDEDGDFKVYVRQKSLPDNYELVGDIPAAGAVPSYSIDFYGEKTTQIIPGTDEYTWTSNNFGIQGSGAQLDLSSNIGSSEKTLYLRTRATENTVASEVQSLTIPARPEITVYTVNFDTEKTSQAVPSTDNYSYNSDMSSPTAGAGTNLDLVPGTTLYFQTPYVDGIAFQSEVHQLTVPARPVISFSIDYSGETTNEVVSSDVRWADNAGMSSSIAGGNIKLGLSPGTDIWLQKDYSVASFRSDVYPLPVANRVATPATAVDYVNEVLSGVTGTPQWDAPGSYTTVFNNQDLSSYIEENSGSDKDIHVKYPATSGSFESLIQTVPLPKRNVKPTISAYDDNLNTISFSAIAGFPFVTDYEYTINNGSSWQSCNDFTQSVGDNSIGIGELRIRLKASNAGGAERFAGESILSTQGFTSVGTTDLNAVGLDVADEELYGTTTDMEYAFDGVAGPWTACSNGKTVIPIDPQGDFTVHIRQASMTSNQQVVKYVPPAGVAPVFTIDFDNETTATAIPITDEYSWDNSNFIFNGAGVKFDLSGEIGSSAKSMYIRHEATEDEVASIVQVLSIPGRPTIPSYGINFTAEQTNIAVAFDIDYSTSSDMSGAASGSGIAIDLTPGINVYFQQPFTTSSFRSSIYFLDVPDRPAVSYSVDYVNERTNEAVSSDVEYDDEATMGSPSSGTNTNLLLTPGTNFWFRQKPSVNSFKSSIFELTVPARPSTPNTLVDYLNERLTSVPSNAEWNASGSYQTVGENQSLTSYIPSSSGSDRNISIRVASNGSSFASSPQSILVAKRNPAPVISDHDDMNNTVTFTAVAGYSAAPSYEFSVDAGDSWTTCSGFTQQVGNVDIAIGDLKIRLKASDSSERFSGELSSSNFEMTFTDELSLDGVDVIVSSNLMTGTTDQMEFALRIGSNPIGSWLPCSPSFTPIGIPALGNVEVHVRQASNTNNARLVKVIPPAAPAPFYTVDFTNETTQQTIPITDEYTWMSGFFGVPGNGSKLDFSGEIGATDKTLYLRTKATFNEVASQIQNLLVPARPVVTSYTIDYSSEKTNQIVPTTDQYSVSTDMSGAFTGNNQTVTVTPGVNLYFNSPATSGSFASEIYTLTVPDRPIVSFSINYGNETTNEILTTGMEWDDNAEMSSPTSGSNGVHPLVPGVDLWFRKKAVSATSFASEPFALSIPDRAAAPVTEINYFSEKLTSVPAGAEWNASGSFQTVSEGENLTTHIPASSGSDKSVDVHIASTVVSFSSYDQTILLKKRAAAPSITAHNDDLNTFTFTAVSGFVAASNYEYSVNGGSNWAACSSFTPFVGDIDISAGDLQVRVNASSASGSERFAGETASSTFVMTQVGTVTLDAVVLLVNAGLLTGTSSGMEYAIKPGASVIGPWTTCNPGLTNISIDPDGDFEVHVRQASNTTNTRLVKYVQPSATAPDYSIDYTNETTQEFIPTTDEYSWVSGSFALSGTGTKLNISNQVGTSTATLYIRTKATIDKVASQVKTLTIPIRPAVTSYSINYSTESTNQTVPSSDIYSTVSDMSGAKTGTGSTVAVTPAVTLYFMKPATASSFASLIYEMNVPARPVISYTINYVTERTSESVPLGVEWDDNLGMTSPTNGTGSSLVLAPGTDIWFRQKAVTGSSFASEKFALTVPDRGTAPTTELDWINERLIAVPINAQWDASGSYLPVVENQSVSAYIPSSTGSDKTIQVRLSSSGTSFASQNQSVLLHKRPPAPVITGHSDDLNTFTFNEVSGYPTATSYEYSVNGGAVWASCNGFNTYVGNIDIPVGSLKVRLKASNESGLERFTGEAASSTFEMTQVGEADLEAVALLVHSGLLTGTSSDLEYAIKPGGESIGAWTTCSAGLTNITIDPDGDFEVHVRQATNTTNTRMVKSVPAAASAPAYSINYTNETTNEFLPSTDEYSWEAGSFSLSGNGTKLSLNGHIGTSSEVLYIRTKATIDRVASEVRQLNIPARPLVTSYSINYDTERTTQIVAGNVSYSEVSDMSGAVSGSNSTVSLEPGVDLYFVKPATSSSFASVIYELVVPSRPEISYGVNYITETTNEVVSSSIEWDDHLGMTSPTDGTDVKLGLTPGTDLWLRKKAEAGISFASEKFALAVPSRPDAPYTELDWINERLVSVPINAEWDVTGSYLPVVENQSLASYVPASNGSNTIIHVRLSSSVSSFASEIQAITLLKRNSAPTITAHDDDLNTFTFSAISGYPGAASYEYSVNGGTIWAGCSAFTTFVGDIDIPVGNLKVRLKASSALGSERFKGDAAASTFVMTQVGEVDLDAVALLVHSGLLTGTSSDIEYAIKPGESAMGTWTTCNAGLTSITIDPDGDFEVHVRQASNTTNTRLVKSVPAVASAPVYSIDYGNEKTLQVIPETDEYSWTAGSFSLSGSGAKLSLNGQIGASATTLFLRTKATNDKVASRTQTLTIPARPVVNAYTINYPTERTTQAVPSSVRYSASSDMSSYSTGTGSTIVVVPDNNLYFMMPATGSSFASEIYELIVSSRPTINFTLNYFTEKTNEVVPAGVEWDDNSGMTSPVNGANAKLNLTPGTDIWLREKSVSGISFASDKFALSVPDRPGSPDTEIDWLNERLISVPINAQWDVSGAFLAVVENQNLTAYIPASTEGNKTINVRISSSGNSFASYSQEILLPKRKTAPVITDHDDDLNTITFSAISGYGSASSYQYSVNGGTTWMNCTGFTQNVGDLEIPAGSLKVRLMASSQSGSERFSGELASSDFDMTQVGSVTLESVILYVNSGQMFGTLAEMEYAIKPTGQSIGAWTMCNAGVTPIDIDPDGDFEVYVRQISNITNSRMVKYVPASASAPDYTINFTNETTQQIIPSTDEYTWSAGAFGVSGAGIKLDISPQIGAVSRTLYIRTKATQDKVPSQVKVLNVPARPSTPSFTVNYTTERTSQLVPSSVSYSTFSNMSGAFMGSGASVQLTPGVNLYFYKPATSSSFASGIFELVVASRPTVAFSIDYLTERTLQIVTTDIEWDNNSEMSSPESGQGNTITLSPGTDLWFRKQASSTSFKSVIFKLNVPDRPSPPSYSLDYVNERTNETVPTSQEWANQSNMVGATGGAGTYVPLSAGTNYYFRKKSTSGSFASLPSSVLVVPARPVISYSVDFKNQATVEGVPPTDIWATNSGMTPSTSGNGARLALTPGEDIYFQRKAVADVALASEIFLLNVHDRPSTPEVLLDYVNEKTNIVIPSEWEWSNASSMSGAADGPDDFMTLIPSRNYYFRKKYTSSSFASETSEALVIPARPTLSYSVNYAAEQTNEDVDASVIYADNENLFSPSVGGGHPIVLTPGTDMWFKQAAVPNVSLASDLFKLEVADQPSSISYEVDFINERTHRSVASYMEWSNSADMSGATSGTNAYLSLIPGENYYFRKKPTSTAFASEITELLVPARPAIFYSINYLQETTNQIVSSGDRWSYSSAMTSSSQGTGVVLDLIPGKDVWFQKEAVADEAFASEILHVDVPDRPAIPSYTLDYINERTKENVSGEVDWSVESDLSSAQPGSDIPLVLEPSTSYYFRKRATASSFSSLISSALIVPSRPVIAYTINYSSEQTNENVLSSVEWSNSPDMASSKKGAGGKLSLEPGTNVWFIKPAVQNVSLASSIFYLHVPDRPATPQVIINYEEEIVTNVPPSCQWSLSGSFVDLANNTVLTANIPAYGSSNMNVKIKIPEASTSFASLEQAITIPARDRAPQINSYDDVSIPNKLGWSGIPGFSDPADYEYNINNTSWDECDEFNQDIPADIEILAGDLSLRLAASNNSGEERFAGEEVFSTTTFSGEKSISLSYIAINLISGQITGTSSKLEYSLDATDWDNGTWFTASDGNTNVSFDMNGGFFVMVRQKGLESNRRVVIEVKEPAEAPAYGINYFNETLDNPLLVTDEMTWNSNLTGFVAGDGVTAPALNVSSSQRTIYLRTKITETTVPSQVQALVIPARETLYYNIDYDNESTVEIIGLNVEYGYDNSLSSPLPGEDKVLGLKPDQDVWFRRLASGSEFKSAISKLEVPSRYAPTPSFVIDFENLKTTEPVSDEIVFWEQSAPEDVFPGENEYVELTPGNSVFFQHIPMNDKFASEVFALVSPFRPDKPSPVIDYKDETLTNIEDVCEWNVSGDYAGIAENQSISDYIPEDGMSDGEISIRLKATNNAFASDDTLLILSARPPAPEFASYDDEGDSATWNFVIGYEDVSLYEYSITNGLSWIDCSGKTIHIGDVHVGKGELQLRLKANETEGNEHFAGSSALSDEEFRAITLLIYDDVKADISKGILIGTSYEMEYSLNSTIGLDGDWTTATDDTTHIDYPMGGGYKIFVRQKGKETNYGHILDVRFALLAPEFKIDYAKETLSELVWDTVEIAKKADMSDALSGTNEEYHLLPGLDTVIYIRYAATEARVPSAIQELSIPERREAPVFTIDYWNEASNEEVPKTVEWTEDPLMEDPLAGAGYRISVNPKEQIDSIYFRYRSTDTSFVSETFILVVPALIPTPDVHINYEDETVYNVPINCEWNVTGHFNLVSEGQSLTDYIPGSSQGFRKVDVRVPASGSSFSSGTAILKIMPRSKAPVISAYDDYLNTITWNPVSGVSDPLAYEISIDSGLVWESINAFEMNVGDTVIETGDIMIRVAASNSYGYYLGDVSVSTKPFSKSEAISFEAVEADIAANMLYGTTPSMEYSITSTDGSDGEWIIISGESVAIEYPTAGGFNIYARQIDEPRNVSLILDVKPAANPPAYSIDYFNERINKPFTTNVEYSWYEDMSGAVTGDGSSVLKLNPTERDSFIYIRYISTESTVPSNVLELKIPARPGADLSIDYYNETTKEALSPLIVWAKDEDFTFLNGGRDEVIPMVPGESIWYLQLASGMSFVSDTFKLFSPERPVSPEFSIDFMAEKTYEIAEDYIVWAENEFMEDAVHGTGTEVLLIPGQNMWFAVGASDSGYASLAFMLEVPSRPEGPSFASIDYEHEELIGLNDSLEVVFNGIAYAISEETFDISDFISNEEGIVSVRYPSDGLSYFASVSYDLTVDPRPLLPDLSLVHVNSDKGRFEAEGITISGDLNLEYQKDGGTWLPITNSTVVIMGGQHTILVRQPATENSFESLHSDNLNSRLEAQLIDMIVVDGVFDSHLYIGGIQHYKDNRLRIYTRWGQEIYDVSNYQNEFDFRDYPAGTYYYLISYTDEDGVKRELKNFVEVIKKQ